MKKAILFAFAMLLTACDEEPITFGLDVRHLESDTPHEHAGGLCMQAGDLGGSSAFSISSEWSPPHFWWEVEADAEEEVYRVRAYVVSEYEEGSRLAKSSEVLAERTYDSEFGERGAEDSFAVDFEGKQHTFEVLGLPATARCARSGAASPAE
ncbi:hypothetical protein [Sorangium sp. So ce1099]|uniref:hypothetical protein n=1 Tax=Sorangium sp. So ce1099 TaxID=3133331 RepID=UPI003F5D8338